MGDERIEPASRAAWRAWLRANHARPDGIWVVFPKPSKVGPRGLRYDDLIEEALCYGWIDSRPRTVDSDRTSLWFTPRKKGSVWAATNKARVERLMAEGRMAAPGLATVDRAKADGSWSKIDGSEAYIEPDDLLRAFRRHAGAKRSWDGFPPGVRKQILQWIELAKTPATREKRITETAEKAARNIRANQWVRPADR
jgi:uncharacterized protein YdeI (YjbR/CyaY-like superfamily)